MKNAERRTYTYQRSTQEFHLYAAAAVDGQAPIVYLPKNVIGVGCHPPTYIEMIVGKADFHQCNCEYCTRRARI